MKVKYFDLKNKKVFITGGGSGIGASIVEHFCEQECDVYFVDINKKDSNKLIKDLNININLFYSSIQLRAQNTLKLIQEVLEVESSSKSFWQLNERYVLVVKGLLLLFLDHSLQYVFFLILVVLLPVLQ